MRAVLNLKGMAILGATCEDIQEINAGGGDSRNLRFEIGWGRIMIRCAQGHSGGRGVRPDCIPVASDVEYAIHGTSQEEEQLITQEGLSRRRRLHIHFCECDRHGNVMGDNNVRCGSDVAILISARQCVDDGIVFYRSANNVVLSEGIGGVIGPQYFRFTHRLRRYPK